MRAFPPQACPRTRSESSGRRRWRFRLALGLALALAAFAPGARAGPEAAGGALRAFRIPAGLAEDTLRVFAEQAGTEFVFSADKVRGVRTNALQGDYPPRQALDRLLAGTALCAVEDEQTGALTVDRARPPGSTQEPATAPKKTYPMPRTKTLVSWMSALAAAVGSASLSAQTVQPEPPAASGQTVELPRFTVTENHLNPYQSQEALSASRTAMPIMDIPQSISVVTKEFIQDSDANRMLDAAKYVTPIVESTLPYGSDRYMIRGFQVSEEFIDGTNISGPDGYSMSLPVYNIERLEIIKGPNAILVPGGSPGGVINPITKSPQPEDFATLTLDASEYNGDDAWFDVNRTLDQDRAMRVVGAYWDYHYYIHGQFRRGYEFSPSFAWQLNPSNKLIIKSDFVQNRETNLGGVPIDPSVGTGPTAAEGKYAQIARGLPRDFMFGNDSDSRHRHTERVSGELLSNPAEHVSSRLYLMVDHVHRRDVGGTSAGLTQGGGGSVDPFTGLYEPGVTWNTSSYNANGGSLTGTANPVTDPSTWVYTRNNGLVDLDYQEAHLKNDYAAKFAFLGLDSTTLAGYAANFSEVHYKSYVPAARPPVPANNLGSITFPTYAFAPIQPGFTSANLGTDRIGKDTDAQAFAYETLSAFNDRVLLSGGVSRFWGELTRSDTTGTAILSSLPTSPDYNLTSNATSIGLVVKPIKQVSLFASQNTSGGTMPGSINAGVTDPATKVAVGGQKEFGFKTSFWDGRLTTSFSHFQITQSNYAVTNSQYYSLVALGQLAAAAALPQALYIDLRSVGYEFEATYAVNKNLTVLGNLSYDPVRIPITNVRPRGVPDHSSAVYADYRFSEGPLKGFDVNVGVDYKGDVAGENATGYTTTRPLPGGPAFVPVQPSFYVKGRTLTNIGVAYRAKNWSVSLTALNALDVQYVQASLSRTGAYVGTPRDFRGSFEYKF
ncbi:MAG TPA: TonB-dependent receptor [Opitutaceae bacterium]|nr:TonB-dependent receptor [Opitutaceae bacterium]